MKKNLTIIGILLFFTFNSSFLTLSAQERGFIHPGGLHTQADFDRVKALLAEGNETVTQAYNVLKTAAYAQSSAATYPSESIVRGGSGENYINAARGATIAYQNALRWKIEGNKACAAHAVDVLMQWARTTKYVTGTSDQCLARGLYGYQFAQAAELVRDYEGWALEDFETFRQWMLTVWYPGAIGFLRVRNGTWENVGKWWQAPGHYWSNWGLCNAMCVLSIGILCDDVFIYNQGLSFMKYDQVGTFTNPRTANPILNDGLTEYLGNLVVTTSQSALETGAYGALGQMNESGRDTGHPAMALGLAVDIAQLMWNQGNDLFSYMDHRLAAGIEYIAAQVLSVEGLPWTNYSYGTNGIYYTDSRCWTMTEPCLGVQIRPCWGTVIGHYEGVKGVVMPYSEQVLSLMGIDGGGAGGTSGGYDQLGYSVLMNTRAEQLCPADKRPTPLSPRMDYSGSVNSNLIPSLSVERALGHVVNKTIYNNELGGLVNTFTVNNKTGVPTGQTVTLTPQLPDGESDTGLWQWNTGETTRSITVNTDHSYVYRATYTNQNGVQSQIAFSIAALGDCTPTVVTPYITYNDETVEGTDITVFYGETVTLSASDTQGFGTYAWSNSKTGTSITLTSVKSPQDITCTVTNQGGCKTTVTFHIDVRKSRQEITVDDVTLTDTASVEVEKGSNVTFSLNVPSALQGTAAWEDGTTGYSYVMAGIDKSQEHTLTCNIGGEEKRYTFSVTAIENDRELSGNYVIRHRESGLLLTSGTSAYFAQAVMDGEQVDASQQWTITTSTTGRCTVKNQDGKYISTTGTLNNRTASHLMTFLASEPYASICAATSTKYWQMSDTQSLQVGPETERTGFPFEIVPVDEYTAISTLRASDRSEKTGEVYDITGRRVNTLRKGNIYIIDGQKSIR